MPTALAVNAPLLKDRTPNKRSWQVRLPVGHRAQFAANFEVAATGGALAANDAEEADVDLSD